MLKLMNDLPDNVIGVTAEGKVTGQDYETVLIPAVEKKLKEHESVNLIYNLSESFTGYDIEALTDDAKLGMKHLSSWKKIAFVSDHEMLNSVVRYFGYMFSCEVRIFKNSEMGKAKEWVTDLS